MDDGSTDDTSFTIGTISSEKLFYFKKANGERGAARNYGMDKSRGRYIVFMDSDDRMETNHLLELYRHLELKEEDFIATKYSFFNDQQKIISNDVMGLKEGYHNFKTFLIGNPLACCFTIRRNNLNLILFREELEYTIMEDWIFLMENLQNSNLLLLNKYTMSMRDHDARSMKGNSNKIVNARENATQYLISKITFAEDDRRILIGNSDYFCAVHAYIGGNTSEGLRYLLASVRSVGISLKTILLFLKLCVRAIWIKKKKGS